MPNTTNQPKSNLHDAVGGQPKHRTLTEKLVYNAGLVEDAIYHNRIRTLTCCCCGASTRGRQWWNRDTGFGICPPCVVFVRSRGETQIEGLYGTAGVHYDVAE
jgi:hypothetical protein